MTALLIVLYVLVCVLLVLAILIQSNRSGTMGLFGTSDSVFGTSGLDLIAKITAWFGVAFVVLAFGISYVMSKGKTRLESELEKVKRMQQEQAPATPVEEGEALPEQPSP